MLSAPVVLAVVAGCLFLVALIPQAQQYPLLSVAVLLLSVALFVMGGR